MTTPTNKEVALRLTEAWTQARQQAGIDPFPSEIAEAYQTIRREMNRRAS